MSADLINELNVGAGRQSIITIIGVGGGGGNAVDYMYSKDVEGATFMVCNTDRQALDKLSVRHKILLGDGLGAGNNPVRGREAAVASLDSVRQALESLGTRMIFIAAGMGGGTGTGASPVIAKLAHEMGILTVAIVTLPFIAEGLNRYEQACKGIEELKEWVDSLLILNNNNMSELYGRMSLKQAFDKANDVLYLAARGIAEIITVPSDLVNVDFADVDKVMRGSGRVHMSVASATGENRSVEAAEALLVSPLLDNHRISGAENILLNISVASQDELKLDEVTRILNCIQEHAGTRNADGKRRLANIIWGTSVKPSLGDALELVIVATGFDQSLNYSADDAADIIEIDGGTLRPGQKSTLGGDASRQPNNHVLSARGNGKYDDIDKWMIQPAYKRRNMPFDTETPLTTLRRESLREESKNEQQNDQSLF